MNNMSRLAIVIALSLCGYAKAEPELLVKPSDKEILITVSNYPTGRAVALLVSNNLNEWTLATDNGGDFYIHYARETNEPVSWAVPVNSDKAFFKAIVLTYKTERNK